MENSTRLAQPGGGGCAPCKAAPERTTGALRAKHYRDDSDNSTPKPLRPAIGSLPASEKQQRLLLALGFDALTHEWTAAQAALAFDEAREQGLKPDWRRLREVGL